MIFLPPLCIITYVPFAGSKTKCYFYLEVLQKQNVNKIQAFLVISACLWGRKEPWVFFYIIIIFELNSCNAVCALHF